jgi:hypothetical protein
LAEGARPEDLSRLAGKSVTLARLVAGNASADGELLERLGHHEDRGVRRKVAGNPSTPAATALTLGGQFPAELLGNPSFDLYLLEAPELLSSLGISSLRAMLKREGCPESLMAWASRQGSEATQLAVLANAGAPSGIVEALAGSAHERVRAAAMGHVALASRAPRLDWEEAFRRGVREEWTKTGTVHEAHRALAFLIMEELGWARLPEGPDALAVATAIAPGDVPDCGPIIASGLVTDEDELARLARDPVPGIRAGVAGNPGTPADLLRQLAKDEDSAVRSAVAENPTTPISVRVTLLEQLAKDAHHGVRMAVASNAATPVPVLEQLAKDADHGVRLAVASNAATPVPVLEQLAKDAEGAYWVRPAVASNAATPVPVLEQLAKDENSAVRSCVASNATTPAALLEQLAKDKDSAVRSCVASNATTPAALLEQLANDEEYDVREAVASNAATPVPVLEQLAKDEFDSVRAAISANPATPAPLRAALLEQLANDEYSYARRAVASNAATPVPVLEQLAKDKNSVVRAAIASNAATPVPVLEQLAKDEDSDVLEAVAGNPSTPPDVLRQLSEDQYLEVLLVIARNPATPRETRSGILSLFHAYGSFMGRGALAASGDAAEVLDFLRGRLSVPRKMLKRVSTARGAGDAQGLRREFIDRMAAASAASLHRTVALLQPFCPPETLARYQRSSWWIDRAAIARHPDCPAPVLKALSADASPVVRAAVSAWKPPTGDEVAHMLADVPEPASDWRKAFEVELDSPSQGVEWAGSRVINFYTRWRTMNWRLECVCHAELVDERDRRLLREIRSRLGLARKSSTPIGLLEQLAKDECSTVRIAVASNAATPVPVLEQLAKDEYSDVRVAVSGHPATPAPLRDALLTQLAKDEYGKVRRAVAENPATTVVVLVQLAAGNKASDQTLDGFLARQAAVTRLENASSLLDAFAKNRSRDVRRAVAGNALTSVAVLEVLAKDKDEFVRAGVAGNPSTSLAVLERFAQYEDKFLRAAVAGNPSTPIALLEQLAKHADSDVRESVAGNPSTPADVLRALAVDNWSDVRAAVAGNPAVPADVLEALLLDPGGNLDLAPGALEDEASLKQLRAELLAGMLSGKKPSRERAYGLLQPECPVPVLTRCARSSLWLERCAIAQNPGTPEKVLRQLAVDPVPAVRGAAQERLASGRA